MYLKMYLAGNEKKVWDEIESLKVSDLTESKLADVTAVCQETANRVKSNCERIVSALKSINYDFGKYPDGEDHFFEGGLTESDEDIDDKLKYLESIAGELPLFLKIFWKTVGSISLVGFLKGWPEFSDPLFVASVNDNIETVEDWQSFREECEDHSNDPFVLYVSPDEDQKDNYEGDQYYNIKLPCNTVDAMILNSPSETTFVGYLREAFEAKGFPGLEELPEFLADLKLLRI